MLLLGENTAEILKNAVEPVLILRWSQYRNGGLATDNHFDFRDNFDDHLSAGAESAGELVLPCSNLVVTFGEKLSHEFLKRLNDRTIRDIASELIKLTGN